MNIENRSLHITNAWKSLVTETSVKYFLDHGWQVDGNWLNQKPISGLHKVILAAPAEFDGAIIVEPKQYPKAKIFSYLIFPDELVGWDSKEKRYKKEQNSLYLPLIQNTPILSESEHTLRLAIETYQSNLYPNREVTYLPIEFYRIKTTADGQKSNKKRPLRVLWSHMWRSDKGFIEALTLIDQLSRTYKDVEFFIGRNERWGGNDTPQIKIKTRPILSLLRKRTNVRFIDNYDYDGREAYWKSLSNMDISFSVSPHEGFGLGMLEQASAGVACIVPNRESYVEIQAGWVTDNIGDAIAHLIENPSKIKEVSQKSQSSAAKFNAEAWTKKILQIIE